MYETMLLHRLYQLRLSMSHCRMYEHIENVVLWTSSAGNMSVRNTHQRLLLQLQHTMHELAVTPKRNQDKTEEQSANIALLVCAQ